jgi:hypothetical protein
MAEGTKAEHVACKALPQGEPEWMPDFVRSSSVVTPPAPVQLSAATSPKERMP